MIFPFFKKDTSPAPTYDPQRQRPVIRASICTGEQTACLQDRETGRLEEVMLLRTPADRAEFCRLYGVIGGELPIVY